MPHKKLMRSYTCEEGGTTKPMQLPLHALTTDDTLPHLNILTFSVHVAKLKFTKYFKIFYREPEFSSVYQIL